MDAQYSGKCVETIIRENHRVTNIEPVPVNNSNTQDELLLLAGYRWQALCVDCGRVIVFRNRNQYN